MNVVEAVAGALAQSGITDLFGLLGDGNLELVTAAVRQHGMRFHAARHELPALAMADGYARASGRTAVCTVTHGPGLTQVGTALVTAVRAHSPVLVLAGAVATAARRHAQRLDQDRFVTGCGARTATVTAATAVTEVQQSLRALAGGRGPVVLHLPLDVQRAAAVPTSRPAPLTPAPPRVPDEVTLAGITTACSEAERPLILAGRGAVRAETALVALAERLGAPLATSLLGRGLFDDHPLHIGLAGGFASKAVEEIITRADLVLAFGASLNRFTTDHGRLLTGARVVHVDHEREAIGGEQAVDLAVVADADQTARALLAALTPSPRPPWAEQADPPVPADGPGPFPDLDDGLDPRKVVAVADDLVAPRRSVVVGVGHYSGWAVRRLRVTAAERLILPWELGAVGLALGVGIGVAAARPDEETLVVEGDGGTFMALGELDTAVRLQSRLLLLVLDDAAYGAELHLPGHHDVRDLATHDSGDLAEVARALGWRAWRADTTAELEVALAEAARGRTPRMVVATISRAVVDELVFSALAG